MSQLSGLEPLVPSEKLLSTSQVSKIALDVVFLGVRNNSVGLVSLLDRQQSENHSQYVHPCSLPTILFICRYITLIWIRLAGTFQPFRVFSL